MAHEKAETFRHSIQGFFQLREGCKMQRKYFLATIFMVTLAMLVTFQTGQANAYGPDELLKLSNQIQNETPGIDLKLKTEKPEYAIGEDVIIEFQADKDCYLALIDIGTSGKSIILFPNKWRPDNRIEKGKTYRIPPLGSDFSFRVMAPAGVEHIKALASIEPVLSRIGSLQEELKQPIETKTPTGSSTGQVFLSMKDPGVVLKDIGLVFQKLDASKWATKQVSFKIVEAAAPTEPQPPAAAPPQAQVGSTPAATAQPASGEVFKPASGLYELRYDPAKWKLASSSFPDGDTAVIHVQTQLELNAISQKAARTTIEALRKEFVESLQAQGSEATIKEEKVIRINDRPVTSLTINGKTEGMAWTVRALLWAGDAGTIKVIGGYPEDIPQTVRDEMETLLNGLMIP